jgi:protein SCO1/2
MMSRPAGRRDVIGLAGGILLGGGLAMPARAGSGGQAARPGAAGVIDMTGISPSLALAMTRATDGRRITAADYRGKLALLYFGYTFCPDVCPLTLTNLSRVLDRLGPAAARVRVLFVTVDPDRDSLAVLKQYAAAFAPQVDGLRGTPDALAALARRYRIAYSVTPASPGHPYEVTHSSAIYVFDGSGAARLLIPSLATQNADIAGVADDLRRVMAGPAQGGLFSGLLRYLEGQV